LDNKEVDDPADTSVSYEGTYYSVIAPYNFNVNYADGRLFSVVIDGVEYFTYFKQVYSGVGYFGAPNLYEPQEYPFNFYVTRPYQQPMELGLRFTPEGPHTVTITEVTQAPDVVCLDDKFLSDNIARVTAVVDLQDKNDALAERVAGLESKFSDDEGSVSDLINIAKEELKEDASNKDVAVLAEAQKGIAAVQEIINAHVGAVEAHITEDERTAWNAAQANAEATAADALAVAREEIAGEIAQKANSEDVYTKEQTYTQTEVDEMLTAAMSWGSF
jgi:hypothetical protein